MEAWFQGWQAKLLSQAGRATFVKHVAFSIPIYAMSSFLLPKGWCNNLEKLARAFLWLNDLKVLKGFTSVAWKRCANQNLEVVWALKTFGILTEY